MLSVPLTYINTYTCIYCIVLPGFQTQILVIFGDLAIPLTSNCSGSVSSCSKRQTNQPWSSTQRERCRFFFFFCAAHDAVICCPSFCSSCWLQATMQVRALPQLLYWHKLCVVSHNEFQIVMTTWSAAWAGSKFLAVIACAFAVPSFLVLWICFLRLFASNCQVTR